jgi:hypothetical protein
MVATLHEELLHFHCDCLLTGATLVANQLLIRGYSTSHNSRHDEQHVLSLLKCTAIYLLTQASSTPA